LLAVAAALTVDLSACAKDSPLAPATQLTAGEWGGNHADVVVADTTISVLLGCASGQFNGAATLGDDGRFAMNGMWNISVGPIQLDSNMPAQLSGQVTGNTLTFAIAVNDTVTKAILSLGPATVVLGAQSVGMICPL
jgi:hypothetical protein